jgi:hypothetical protein
MLHSPQVRALPKSRLLWPQQPASYFKNALSLKLYITQNILRTVMEKLRKSMYHGEKKIKIKKLAVFMLRKIMLTVIIICLWISVFFFGNFV